MATLLQVRTQIRLLINQTDSASSDFTDSELNGFVNEGVRLVAALVKWPRDRVEVTVQLDTPAYPLPSDTILLLDAYFGDVNTQDDKKPLRVLSESQLKEFRPNWLDETTNSQGRPDIICLIDRKTVIINPRPDSSQAGKKLEIVYVYYPATLSADGDVPDLPIVYHDLIAQYGQHKCYMSKLNNPALGQSIFTDIISKSKILEPVVTKEFDVQGFTWGQSDIYGQDIQVIP